MKRYKIIYCVFFVCSYVFSGNTKKRIRLSLPTIDEILPNEILSMVIGKTIDQSIEKSIQEIRTIRLVSRRWYFFANDQYLWPPFLRLHYAAKKGDKKHVEKLIHVLFEKGISLDHIFFKKGYNGNSLLHFAMFSGNFSLCKFLTQMYREQRKRSSDYVQCAQAIENYDIKVLKKLLSHINPNTGIALNQIANNDGKFPINMTPTTELIELLEKRFTLTLLNTGILANNRTIVKMLLEAGADPNIMSISYFPLTLATCYRQKSIIKDLLAFGAHVNLQDPCSCTPLMSAVTTYSTYWDARVLSSPEIEIVKILLKAGADPNIENIFGHTALDYATRFRSDLVIIKLLHAYGGKY